MKTNNINKLNCINMVLINNIILIYNNFINVSGIKVIFISILIYYLFNFYLINNVIYMDSTEYLILYNNIYIKGLNSLIENSGELIAYAVGVKLYSIYLKISP